MRDMPSIPCPECGTLWPDGLILSAVRGCMACAAEKEHRVAAWLGESPRSPPPIVATSSDIPPDATMAPRRSLPALLDDLDALGIVLTTDGTRLTASKPPPPGLLAELRERKALLIDLFIIFAGVDADCDVIGVDDPNLRQAMRLEAVAFLWDAEGEYPTGHEVLDLRRRAAGLRRSAL